MRRGCSGDSRDLAARGARAELRVVERVGGGEEARGHRERWRRGSLVGASCGSSRGGEDVGAVLGDGASRHPI